jgi:hypothetical protein
MNVDDTSNNAPANPDGRDGSARLDVVPMAVFERLAKRFKREATLNRKICKQRGRDSDYYFGIAEGLERAATTLRAVAKEKATQLEARSRSS